MVRSGIRSFAEASTAPVPCDSKLKLWPNAVVTTFTGNEQCLDDFLSASRCDGECWDSCLPLFVYLSKQPPYICGRVRQYLSCVFINDVAGCSGLDDLHEDIISFEKVRHLPRVLHMLISI